MSFRRRNYPEVLDNLLTQLIGGVAAESHPFPPPGASQDVPFEHILEQPKAQTVVSVYGLRNGQSRLFGGDTYELRPDGQTLRWRADVDLPDAGTLVHINYLRKDDPPTLTDLQVGSVVRTLTESVALEIARLYAQLQAVYEAGYIDSATNSSLDKVVALLGIERIGAERAVTKIRFTRAAGTSGSITINAGTRIIDGQAKFEYETIETATMAPNQNSITIAARDLEPANDPVEADVLSVLPVPIAGVAGVTNPAPASRAAKGETDAELRRRAKNFLYGSERATLGALKNVLARQQIRGEVLEDRSNPGLVTITPMGGDLSPERRAQLDAELDANRPAGVFVDLVGAVTPADVALDIRLTTAQSLPEVDVRAAHASVAELIRDYFDQLPILADASLNQIVGIVLSVNGVEDIDIQAARATSGGVETDRLDAAAGTIVLASEPTVLGELNISDSNLPSSIDFVLRFPESAAAADSVLIESALQDMLAYLNALMETEGTDPAQRTLNLGKFLRVIPLPGKPGEGLQSFDEVDPQPSLPTSVDVAPYVVSVLVRRANGLTRVLDNDSVEVALTIDEPVALASVNVSVE